MKFVEGGGGAGRRRGMGGNVDISMRDGIGAPIAVVTVDSAVARIRVTGTIPVGFPLVRVLVGLETGPLVGKGAKHGSDSPARIASMRWSSRLDLVVLTLEPGSLMQFDWIIVGICTLFSRRTGSLLDSSPEGFLRLTRRGSCTCPS